MTEVSGKTDIQAQALEVAAGWSPPGAPVSWQLTAALFRLIAGHEARLGALVAVPLDRLPAMLASAAICFLVQRDQPKPLASYFPQPGRPQPPFGPGFDAAARDFVSGHLAELTALCQRHPYQMNEVARCTQMALGIAAAHADLAAPVALVDLGTGAGLGLQLDRYRYAIDGTAIGPPDAALTVACERRGADPVPRPTLPPIAYRAGIEVAPVDLEDAGAVAWLRACVPPEASALTPPELPVIVTGSVQGLALPDWLVSNYQDNGVFAVLGERTFAAGAEHARLLARAHPSGQWVEWLEPG